jgi:tetratricopeptide (TPR) repeat protein
MRIYISFLFLFFLGLSASASTKTDSLLTVLKKELVKKKVYDDQKEARIEKLRNLLSNTPQTNYIKLYELCSNLYEEYKVYQFDSAYVYTNKLLDLSHHLKDQSKEYDSKMKLGFILCSAGMFKQTFDCLNKINAATLNNDSKVEYYSLKARAYSDLADYDNDAYYTPYENAESVKYLDSAIRFCKPDSFDLLIQLGTRQSKTGDTKTPSKYLIRLLNNFNITTHQRARVATALSLFYTSDAQSDERIQLLTIGAINDIRASIKETLAAFLLGQELYHKGNMTDAYMFIQEAMGDAEYYGARLRKIKIGAVLPVVGAQKLILVEKEKNKVIVYLLSITAVSALVLLVFFIIFIQLKRLKAKEKIIEEKNVQLEQINEKLGEDTRIKEEYIGYFFNVISGYILKLEKLKRSIDRKLVTKKYEDIQLVIDEINIKKERETLFYTFDHTFLKIFPDFITTFNSLFKKEDQIWPKDNEVLNTDLRIFALKRMGISDDETVASILEYSVKTIYVYKMRIKAKSIYPSDQFDQKLMESKAFEALKKP